MEVVACKQYGNEILSLFGPYYHAEVNDVAWKNGIAMPIEEKYFVEVKWGEDLDWLLSIEFEKKSQSNRIFRPRVKGEVFSNFLKCRLLEFYEASWKITTILNKSFK